MSARIIALISAIVTLWGTALVDGIITGVGILAGVEPSEEGIGLAIMEAVCQSSEKLSNPKASVSAPQVCWTFYGIVAILSIVIFLINIFSAAAALGDWRWGLVIYGCGFIPGILLTVAR